MGKEWECVCKDCNRQFAYSNTKYEAGAVRGLSRPERCDECRAQHAREIQSLGQAYYKVKALKPIVDPKRLTSDLGRFNREDRPHNLIVTQPQPIDPNKFGIKDDRLIEMFHFFKQDPGLQVVVVVGPTGSGKSTYFPYRLVEIPTSYRDASGNHRAEYWTVPIETDADLQAAQNEVKHTILSKGVYRHYTSPPNDPRAQKYQVGDLDPNMFHRYGQIVITQPRIQATRNIPDFIAKAMMGCKLGAGHDVGFRHSGAPNSDWSTKLAFVTDGTLITWIAKGELDKINTVMIDEAHERSLNIDIIIGMLTKLLPRYPRLRLIIASATISSEKFINHFNKHLPQRRDAAGNILPNCRFMEFEGKSFKVSPHFRREDEAPLDYYREDLPIGTDGKARWEGRYREPKEIYKQVAEKAIEILKAMYDTSYDGGFLIDTNGQMIDITERQGDILGFLHGEAPIQNGCKLVEELAEQEFGGRVKVKALPLYTTLKQSQQDEALKEREQPHGKLFDEIVKLLEQIVRGEKTRGDILAILNNAGQIHNLCADLDRRVQSAMIRPDKNSSHEVPNPLAPLKGKVQFAPWFTPGTARQLFETMPERSDLKIPPPSDDQICVVISTSRHRPQLAPRQFTHQIELPLEERRVVISTNVAETSLTIHGILHVVDSGLINQNKWDPETQTSAVSAILQSRAGCKQRWGRAGRLQAGDAWLLYTEKQFGKEQGEDDDNPDRCFDFYSRPEISRSPLEQVLLTAKKSGAESLNPRDFPWLDPPDAFELARSELSLSLKGALDADGDLTEHGVELGNMRSDPRIGNMLIVADRFSCALELITVVAVAEEGLKKLLEFDKKWDDATVKEVRQRQSMLLVGCRDDLDAALKLIACWEEVHSAVLSLTEFVKLIVRGDALCEELDAAAKTKGGAERRRLINAIQQSVDPTETVQLAHDLLRRVPSRQRKLELQKAIDQSLRIRRAYQKLGPVWRSVLNSWSFARICDEAVAGPLIADAMVVESSSAAEKEEAIAAIASCLPGLRESISNGPGATRECLNQLVRQLGKLADKRLPSIDLVCSLAQLANPRHAEDPGKIAADLRYLKEFERETLQQALDRLPDAAARAWARANYLNPDTFVSVLAARTELLEPLEAHKKGDESRPLDLSRNDRLRVLFANSLPDNAYLRDASGAYRAVITSDNEVLSKVKLQVEIAADSVCSADPPELFVCVERQSAPYVPGKDRKLFASFIVKLPSDWAEVMRDPKQPLHRMSTPRLGRFIADRCRKDELLGRDLLLDQLYPRGSRCQVVVNGEANPGWWSVTVSPPHAWPNPVVQRDKRASDEQERAEPELEEAIRAPRRAPTDLELTKEQREMQAGEAVEESLARIDPEQWEKLYVDEEAEAEANELSRMESSSTTEMIHAENLPAFGWSFDSVDGLLAPVGSFPSGSFEAEVFQLIRNQSGQLIPCLKYPVTQFQFDQFSQRIGADGIGKEFQLTVVRLEQLLLDAGSLLIAREQESGLEVSFTARDLSFSGCRVVPELIFRHMPPGASFVAKLVQIDVESGRLRMTTHHVIPQSFPDGVIGQQTVELIQHTHRGPFVRFPSPEMPERRGFTLVAKLGPNQLTGEPIGSRHTVHLSLPSRIRESWPRDVDAPADLRIDEEPRPESILFKGQVPHDRVWKWLQEVGGDRLARAALYSLYERTYQLNGMDEAEYRRWESCIDRKFQCRVVRTSSAGLELSFKELADVTLWMPRDEYSWYFDESHADVEVGTTLDVIGTEIDLLSWQVCVSARQLSANPYDKLTTGTSVRCTVTLPTPQGSECEVKRLRGWMPARDRVVLPQEGSIDAVGSKIVAVISRVDKEAGKLILTRWPIVQQRIRVLSENRILLGEVVEIEGNGVRVQLAPNVTAWLPGEEASWRQGRKDMDKEFRRGQIISVVLMPRQPDSREDDLKVSRKRAASREFVVSGSPGLFFAGKPSNLRTVLDGFLQQGKVVGVDTISKGSGGTRILVGSESPEDLPDLVRSLTTMAYGNKCSMNPVGVIPTGPVKLGEIPLPQANKAKEPQETEATSERPRGFLAAIKAFFRRLFGGG